MTVAEFRADKSLRDQWKDMLVSHALLRLVIEVLEDSHPARWAIMGDNDGDVSATRAAIELGTTRGYSKALDTLKLLAVPPATSQPLPETTYSPPDLAEMTDA